jgi:ABC-2 type transport system ATP-binding protein
MLEVEGLVKRYGSVRALDGVSFAVAPGQVFGFVGRNGAGKTTTMRIVLGVLAADAGEVRWQGRPVDASVRGRIGYMPEERGLYPKMRVRDQLVHLARLHGASSADAAAATDRWIERLGLAERARDRVETLSLGNQQRVQLAAALVHEPDLLVLDEPFSGLDPVGVDVLAEALAERVRERGVPVVFSSHQLELVERLCDVVGIISAGSMVAFGRVEDLRAQRSARQWRLRLESDRRGEQRHDADQPGSVRVGSGRLASDGHGDGWLSSLGGVRLLGHRDGALLLELDEGVDDQAVLHAALAQGRVVEFVRVRASLTELFREVVAP